MSYESEVLADAPLAYWRLGELSGTTAADASGNARHGTYTATGVTLAQAGALPGEAPAAARFDGSTGNLFASGVALSGSSFSLECFEKLAASPGFWMLFGQGTTSSRAGLHCGYRNSGSVTLGLYSDDLDVPAPGDVGVWHHWVFTFDASTRVQTIYLDGVQRGSQRTAGGVYTGTGTFYVAGQWDGGARYNGTIDEVAVYGTALSPSRVSAHYGAAVGAYAYAVLADSPTGYWRLEEASGTTALDASRNGRHGAYSGGVALAQPGILSGGACASFNGSSGGVSVPDVPAWDFGDFTLEAWLKTAGAGSGRRRIVCQQHTSGSAPYWLMGLYNNVLEAGSSVDGILSAPGGALNDGLWHHVVLVRDRAAGLFRWYTDGTQRNTAVVSPGAGAYNVSAALEIGRWSSQEHFGGQLDEVAVYASALPMARVEAHYLTGISSAGGNLRRWDGTAWQGTTVKRWDGGAWVTASVRRWDGVSWV